VDFVKLYARMRLLALFKKFLGSVVILVGNDLCTEYSSRKVFLAEFVVCARSGAHNGWSRRHCCGEEKAEKKKYEEFNYSLQ
jgi:hypothetical protein